MDTIDEMISAGLTASCLHIFVLFCFHKKANECITSLLYPVLVGLHEVIIHVRLKIK